MTTALITATVAWIGANALFLAAAGWWLAGRHSRGELRPGDVQLGAECDDPATCPVIPLPRRDDDLEALMRATQEPS